MAIMENIMMFEKEGFAVNILFEGNAFPFQAFLQMDPMESNERKSPERNEEPTEEVLKKWHGKQQCFFIPPEKVEWDKDKAQNQYQ